MLTTGVYISICKLAPKLAGGFYQLHIGLHSLFEVVRVASIDAKWHVAPRQPRNGLSCGLEAPELVNVISSVVLERSGSTLKISAY